MKKYHLISFAEKVPGFEWTFKNDKTDKSIIDWLMHKKSNNQNLLIVFISTIEISLEQYEKLEIQL